MNKKFEQFINETKQRLFVYEMNESAFSECYDNEDRQMMRRLREALCPSKQEVYLFEGNELFKKCNAPFISMEGGNYGREEIQ